MEVPCHEPFDCRISNQPEWDLPFNILLPSLTVLILKCQTREQPSQYSWSKLELLQIVIFYCFGSELLLEDLVSKAQCVGIISGIKDMSPLLIQSLKALEGWRGTREPRASGDCHPQSCWRPSRLRLKFDLNYLRFSRQYIPVSYVHNEATVLITLIVVILYCKKKISIVGL